MLILTRRIGETICIGDDIQVTIIGTQRNEIRVGIEAPKDIPVHRLEVWQRIQMEKIVHPEKFVDAQPDPESEE